MAFAAGITFQIVAKSGSGGPNAPGTSAPFNSLVGNPVMDNQGDVAFFGQISSGGAKNGLWAGPPSAFFKVILQGDAVPGTSAGVVYASVNDTARNWVIAPDGGFMVAQTVTGTGITTSNDTVVLAGYPSSGLGLVAQEGGTYGHLAAGDIYLRSGLMLAFSQFNGSSSSYGIWSGTPGHISQIMAVGTSIQGGGTLANSFSRSFGLTETGEIYAEFTGNTSVFHGVASQLPTRAWSSGGPSPIAGKNFTSSFSDLYYAPSMGVGFRNLITGSQSIFCTGTEGTLKSVILRTDAFGTIGEVQQCESYTVAAGGGILARVTLNQSVPPANSTNNQLLAYIPPGQGLAQAKVVARSGDAVPGVPGAVFIGFNGASFAYTLNANGLAVAELQFSGAGIDSGNDYGIFVWDPANETLQLVTRLGVPQDFGTGALSVSELSFRGGPSATMGLCNGLNDLNQYAFHLEAGTNDYVVIAKVTPDPVPFVIVANSATPGERELQFASVTGKSYQVKYADALGDAWQDFGSSVSGTNGTLSASIGAATPPARYFKVVIQ